MKFGQEEQSPPSLAWEKIVYFYKLTFIKFILKELIFLKFNFKISVKSALQNVLQQATNRRLSTWLFLQSYRPLPGKNSADALV